MATIGPESRIEPILTNSYKTHSFLIVENTLDRKAFLNDIKHSYDSYEMREIYRAKVTNLKKRSNADKLIPQFEQLTSEYQASEHYQNLKKSNKQKEYYNSAVQNQKATLDSSPLIDLEARETYCCGLFKRKKKFHTKYI